MLTVGAFVLAQILDVQSSCLALRQGLRESNPWLPQSCAGLGTVKAGITLGSVLAIQQVHSRKVRIGLYLAATAATGLAVAHNLHTIRSQR